MLTKITKSGKQKQIFDRVAFTPHWISFLQKPRNVKSFIICRFSVAKPCILLPAIPTKSETSNFRQMLPGIKREQNATKSYLVLSGFFCGKLV